MFAIWNFLMRLLIFLLLLIPSNNGMGICPLKKKKKCPYPYEELSLGGNIDTTSRAGKEEKVAMDLAEKDFFTCLNLHVKSSSGDPVQAVTAANILVKKCHARAIVGLRTWQEAALVAEVANNSKVPFLSLANEVPSWACSAWRFMVCAARGQFGQMKAIAAMIRSWEWRKVNIIYEEPNAAITSMIPYLMDALEEIDAEINDIVPLSPLLRHYSLHGKLKNLKNGECRVFIVHTSITLATEIFKEAMNLGMVEKEFVWITTSSITNVIGSLDGSIISSMQGVLGVNSYFSRSGQQFKHFRSRFQALFKENYPEETHLEPGIFALQAYDALRAVAIATLGVNSDRKVHFPNSADDDHTVSISGQQLLTRILKTKFEGLTGAFNFKQGKLVPAEVYSIVNVVGITCKELGYWTEGLGFSVSASRGSTYNDSMRILRKVLWPGYCRSVPSGLAVPKSAIQPLRIGVPNGNSHIEFVNVRPNTCGKPNVTGFSVQVFKRIFDKLPYEFIPFTGNYNSLVMQVYLKHFDAVVGDTAIIANRCQYVEFSQPYAEPGVQMVVYVKPRRSGGAWLFRKPFTTTMWAATGAIVLYNGFVVWLIERKHNPELTAGSKFSQFGSMVSLAFTTLFSLHGEKLHSNLSRMTMVVWLFVALIITSSYTASLTSLLTHQRLEQDIPSVDTLKRTGAKVGCDGDSFVEDYLAEVVGFDRSNIQRIYSEHEYYGNLTRGLIAAAFLEVPYVKVFRAKYCKNFTTGSTTYPVGGFGFAFPKNSEYLPEISQAILRLSEQGKLKRLRESMFHNCSDSENEDDQYSLALSSFEVLFYVTVGTSTVALIFFIIPFILQKHRPCHPNIIGPQPANTQADESWVLHQSLADERLLQQQAHANNELWLSAWEWEKQGP